MDIYLVRHPVSKRNSGRTDVIDSALTPTGEKQAYSIRDYFNSVPLTHIYSSSSQRTRYVARLLGKSHGIRINYSDRLREHNMGEHGAGGIDDWHAYFTSAHDSGDVYNYTPRTGESLRALHTRSGAFYAQLRAHAHSNTIAVIGHGFHLKHVILHALRLSPQHGCLWSLPNASITHLCLDHHMHLHKHSLASIDHLLHSKATLA